MNMKRICTYVVLLMVCFVQIAFSNDRLLIIAPDDFIDALQSLKQFKGCTRRSTTLISLTEIYNNTSYAGLRDNPERIKKCIADYRKSKSITAVMLVGDCDKFPVRYCRATNTQWGTKYYPADLYYADLFESDGTTFEDWDGGSSPYGGNKIYGEIDFDGFGEKDTLKLNRDHLNLIPDVAVGRVPASTVDEVKTFIKKVIGYELKAPGKWFHKVLWLVDGDWGAASKKDRLDQYMTGFTIIKPYSDLQWGVHATNHISRDERAIRINNHINNGVGFMNYFGHGCRFSWSWVYDQYDNYNDMGSLTNQDMLPIVFAVSCYTGRFHFDQCQSNCINSDSYLDVSGSEWSNSNKVATRPEPRAVQPSTYDRGCLAEEFTVKRLTGAVGYIGCGSINEFGGENLDKYFFEAYKNKSKTITLGQMWKYAQTKFRYKEDLTAYHAYLHLYKVNMFGDPSLIVGGAYIDTLSGPVTNSNRPLKSTIRYRVTGDITVPVGYTLSTDSSLSVLFENGKKLVALDSDSNKGFIVTPGSGMSACFLALASNSQTERTVQGIKIIGRLKLRNGGGIKFY